jgi:hypothetical protein
MVTTMEAAFASALAEKAGPTPADVSRLAVARGAHWRCTLRFAGGARHTAYGHTRDGAYLAAWRAAVGRNGRECPAISEVPLTAGGAESHLRRPWRAGGIEPVRRSRRRFLRPVARNEPDAREEARM